MEELQDAIEDAQYVNAIAMQEDGPRPVLQWDFPNSEQLEEWKAKQQLDFDYITTQILGFFMFSAYVKEQHGDYVQINFVEEVLRWRRHFVQFHGEGKRQERRARHHANQIATNYLMKQKTVEIPKVQEAVPQPQQEQEAKQEPVQAEAKKKLPPKTEIHEYDLERSLPALGLTTEEFRQLYDENVVTEEEEIKDACPVALAGPVRDAVLNVLKEVEHSRRMLRKGSSSGAENNVEDKQMESSPSFRNQLEHSLLPSTLFDKMEALVMESLRRKYWDSFVLSTHYHKLLCFWWYRDRPIVSDDFLTMRVLGRGGFGLVTACKKGTSGKLYAMKVMSKKRIKMKKATGLALNEREALEAVQSPFVVNLKYSFHSVQDVYLILDLMVGGDLGFHLQQRGKFPKRTCMYYAARIMLGLQALHDKGYVYRDLKPENCLLADDGRVRLTDFGLAAKVTPTLRGAAGTRGYWAPEMLRRDSRGKKMPYGHSVDWFSFGCCITEFLSGTNPFRSKAALDFGTKRGKDTKEKSIDCAILEMDPPLDDLKADEDAYDFCTRLLEKNELTRLGARGCGEIMIHPWFKDADWELVLSDREEPPFVPRKDVNAASQSEIGTFAEDKAYQETVITSEDEELYKHWDWTNPTAFAAEVIEFLIYERETGERLVPSENKAECCCAIS